MQKNKTSRSGGPTDHGMGQQRFLLLPDESPKQFAACVAMWRAQYDLEEPAVSSLVETLAERDWLQQRCTRAVCGLEVRLSEAERTQPDNLQLIEHLEKRLQNAYRYKTAAENSFTRALRNVEQFRKARYDEDLKDGLFELKKLATIERCLCQRHKQDLPLELFPEIPDDEKEKGTKGDPRRSKPGTQPAQSPAED